jgi:PAS domain S-box-containing protein
MIDLSKLKALTEDLSALEDKYRFIVENLNEGIWQIDENAKTVYANKRLADILGYTPEEMIGTPLTDYIFPEDLATLGEKIERRKQGIVEVHDFTFKNRSGGHVMCLVGTSPILYHGEYRGALAAVTDITHIKEQEYICKAMADAAFTPMLVHRDGIIIDVNAELLKESGFTREELIGSNSYNLFPPESLPIAQQKVATHSTEPYIMPLRRKDGNLYKYEIRGRTLKFNGYSNLRVVALKRVE